MEIQILELSQCKIKSAYEEPRHLATLKPVKPIWQSLFNIAFRKALLLDLYKELEDQQVAPPTFTTADNGTEDA